MLGWWAAAIPSTETCVLEELPLVVEYACLQEYILAEISVSSPLGWCAKSGAIQVFYSFREAGGATTVNNILEQEEIYWCQKCRVAWLKEGERNTRFFHTSTLICRRRNAISWLKISDGSLCDDLNVLKTEAREFYFQLYSAEPYLAFDSSAWDFPRISHRNKNWLNRPISPQEVHGAIF